MERDPVSRTVVLFLSRLACAYGQVPVPSPLPHPLLSDRIETSSLTEDLL